MNRNHKIRFRVNEEEKELLQKLILSENCATFGQYVRSKILSNTKKNSSYHDDLRYSRLFNLSIRLDEETKEKILQKTDNISQFIRDAVLDKLQNSS